MNPTLFKGLRVGIGGNVCWAALRRSRLDNICKFEEVLSIRRTPTSLCLLQTGQASAVYAAPEEMRRVWGRRVWNGVHALPTTVDRTALDRHKNIEKELNTSRWVKRRMISICLLGDWSVSLRVKSVLIRQGMAMVLAGKGHNVTILMRKEEQAHIDSINTRHINTMCFKVREVIFFSFLFFSFLFFSFLFFSILFFFPLSLFILGGDC
jgi:hypothetical protein